MEKLMKTETTPDVVPDVVEDLETETLTELMPSEILDLAADLIEQSGWAKGTPYCEGEGYCMGGAVAQIAVGNPDGMYQDDGLRMTFDIPRSPQLERAMGFLRQTIEFSKTIPAGWKTSTVIYLFNDGTLSDQRVITTTLRSAAKTARDHGE